MASTALESSGEGSSGLRARKHGAEDSSHSTPKIEEKVDDAETETLRGDAETVMGRTPDGTVFTVPHTPDMLTSIFAPNQPKTALDIITITSLSLQIVLFFTLSGFFRQLFFVVYFAFWRAAYNGGLGFILKAQSEKRWIVRTVKKQGWMDAKKRPRVHNWIQYHLKTKMESDYVFEEMPLEYNVWLMFRSIVDVILLNDFVAYSLFAFSCTRLPEGHSIVMHIIRWIVGWGLILFNLWVKMDAHRVVKDYAWYWGDCFFLCLQSLVFDGVYECAPDPMYSLGYAGYYGLSLVSGSYAVLFVSLAAHASQFLFLKFFEGPHIERVYGEKKPIAARVPLRTALYNAASAQEAAMPGTSSISAQLSSEGLLSGGSEHYTTPSQTDGTSATSEDEFSQDEDNEPRQRANIPTDQSHPSEAGKHRRTKVANLHDLHHRLFQKDTVVFRNLDLLRANDFLLVVACFYAIVPSMMPTLGPKATLTVYYLNALAWRAFHSGGLGLLLHRQSESKWMVRHYLKHYVYSHSTDAVYAAFSNWKVIYNTSLVMTYASFGVLCWKCYAPLGRDWTAGTDLLRHTLGVLLLALHVWTATSSYSVLGPFGWLYGDFFIDEYPHQLYYTGIYRFLNNPERTMGGAAFFGLVLISGSKLALSMAVVSQLAHWIFLSSVENPHMTKLYGQAAVSRQGGVSKQLKNVAERNKGILGAAQSHPKFVEVRREWERYQKDASLRLEDFVSKSKPKLGEMVEDTRSLFQQGKDRLLIVRQGDDIATVDRSKYSIHSIPSSSGSTSRYPLGEPIQVEWKAPSSHSRRDWIGIYLLSRFGGEREANEARLVTKISSQGKWVALAEEEWEGDTPLDDSSSQRHHELLKATEGVLVFQSDRLPWVPGFYEVRYHHDAKHNVLARSKTLEIYVDRPKDLSSFDETYSLVANIVQHALDSSYAYLPRSQTGRPESKDVPMGRNSDSDPDDFTIWDVKQAQRIAKAIYYSFDIEFTSEVIVAEANVRKLARDVVEARQVLTNSFRPSFVEQ